MNRPWDSFRKRAKCLPATDEETESSKNEGIDELSLRSGIAL